MNTYVLDEDGNPAVENDTLVWGRWFETAERHLANSQVTDDVLVSTVFLGLDHAFGGGEPVLWETMIFGGEHDGYQERYASKEAARAGHSQAVALATGAAEGLNLGVLPAVEITADDPNGVVPSTTCDHCSGELDDNYGTYLMTSPAGETWCAACFSQDGQRCADCENYVAEELVTIFYNDNRACQQEQSICRNCAGSTKYKECRRCGNLWSSPDFVYHAGESFCQACVDDYGYTCSTCDEEYWSDEGHYCTSDDSGDDDDDDDDYNANGGIHDYTYDVLASLSFLGKPKDKLYLGVELEVEVIGDHSRAALALQVAHAMEDFAVLKSDSSLDYGFEIVSAPATIEIHREQWTKRFYGKPFLRGLRSWDTETCGLHIHISRKPISQLTQAKIVGFCNIPENRVWLGKLAGRCGNYYAQFKDVEQLGKDWKYADCRYQVVNLENYNTLEFRIFKGSLRPERLWRALEFVHSLVKFCGQASVEGLQASKYLEWLSKHKKTYPALAEFYYPKALRVAANPRQPGLFMELGDYAAGDTKVSSLSTSYDPATELTEQLQREQAVAAQRAKKQSS